MDAPHHVCPVWIGYLMNSPLRRFQQDPYKILKPFILSGMNILEIGPALGYFSVPMARMALPDGHLYCVDIQDRMLHKLEKRFYKKNLRIYLDTILASNVSQNINHLKGLIDFCLLANVVHEVPDQETFFKEISETLKSGAKVLFFEPGWHVNSKSWERSLLIANNVGFSYSKDVKISGSKACVLVKS